VQALALDRGIRVRGARETATVPGGVVIRHPGLPHVYHLNSVLLDAPLPAAVDAAAVIRLADAGLAGFRHRCLVLDDVDAAQRLEPELVAAGWSRSRTVFMVWRGEPEPLIDDRAGELSDPELRAIQSKLFLEERPGKRALVDALVEAQAALRAGTSALGFGAGEGEGDEPASSCTLFIDRQAGAAMIEEVGTLVAHRERGLAKAVVSRALRVAVAEGLRPIVIPADADDWPQLMYAKLGFEPGPLQVSFTLARR
jgi:GNAT superfamily N-acetyltransferase